MEQINIDNEEEICKVLFVEEVDNEEEIYKVLLKEQLGKVLHTLNERYAIALCLRYGIGCEEHSLREIGEKFGVTTERVRQIEARALRQFGTEQEQRILRDF